MPGVKRDDLAPADDPGEGRRIAAEAARRVAAAYGDRLREVVLFGSWVRGEPHEESDVDLLVVLGELPNRASWCMSDACDKRCPCRSTRSGQLEASLTTA